MFDVGCAGQEGHQMFGHTDRSHARAAAAVRDAKCFVQIQVTNIRAIIAGTTEPDLRIHVRAVHVNLAAMGMNDVADFTDSRLEHAMGGRISHHQRREIARVLVCFGAQIGEIDVAVF